MIFLSVGLFRIFLFCVDCIFFVCCLVLSIGVLGEGFLSFI